MVVKKNAKHYFVINDKAYFALTRVKLDRLEKGECLTTTELLSELVLKGAEAVKNEN